MKKLIVVAMIAIACIVSVGCQNLNNQFDITFLVSEKYSQDEFNQVVDDIRDHYNNYKFADLLFGHKRKIKEVSYMGDAISKYVGKETAQETDNKNPSWMLMNVKFVDENDEDWYVLYEKNVDGKWYRNSGGSGPVQAYIAIPQGLES